MTGAVPLIPLFQFSDASGKPLDRGWVTVYQAGTDTLATTYQDAGLTVPNTNPKQLDSSGQTLIWLDPSQTYKILLQDKNLVTVPGWPVDNISSAAAAGLSGPLVSVKRYLCADGKPVLGDGVHDDTTGLQACADANPGRAISFPNGTYIVSGVVTWGSNTRLVGESRDRTVIQRTATHTGHTFVFGQDVAGLHAGAMSVQNMWFHRAQTFAPGNAGFVAGTSTAVNNRLTGAQAHIFAHEMARGLIENCAFDFTPYCVVLSGGSASTIRECHFAGSIWDQLTVGLQEGIAMVWLKATAAGQVPTLISSIDNYYSGDERSAPRNVTVGTITANYAENIGAKFGVLIDCCEGFVSQGDYYGGQNVHCLYIAPVGGRICTNIKVNGAFFDGSRLNCIDIDNQDAASSAILVSIVGNVFNGETVCQRALGVEFQHGTPSAYGLTFTGNVVAAFEFAPIYLAGLVGATFAGNIVSAYNCRGGNTGDPAGSAGAFVVGSGAGASDKISFVGNSWGGGTNTYGAVNNCQWGVYFQGTFATRASAPAEFSNGLGLAGGALVNGGDSSVHAPTLLNSWVNNSAGQQTAGYWKDASGAVHLQGTIKSGTVGAVLFNLPVGFRPVAQVQFATVSNGAAAFGNINATGDVIHVSGSNLSFSLDGITFMAA